jgi:hypothetical protein
LRDAINGLLPKFELGFDLFAGQGFNVGRHAPSLSRARRETKQVVAISNALRVVGARSHLDCLARKTHLESPR